MQNRLFVVAILGGQHLNSIIEIEHSLVNYELLNKK